MAYEPVIGLEIHIQLKTKSKMFCSSPNQTEGAEPNTNICEVCTGQPGTLPVINQEAVRKAILLGSALGCKIASYTKFDRKNYFYPDLPKGYQISQFDYPICGRGEFAYKFGNENKIVGITRAHLEEDAGKLVHPDGADYSLVDLNRAGVPLVEIVTEPDFQSPAEARIFLQQLRTLARYLDVSDADMEKGHLRCDANISIRRTGEKSLPPYKVEIKNLNSFKSVEEALEYEIERQTDELEAGKSLSNETRGWSDAKRRTASQRTKEGSQDYRYFPEPDLPVLHITPEQIKEITASMPELPEVKRTRFISEYKLIAKVADHLVSDKELASYFEKLASELAAWLEAEGMMDEKRKNGMVKEAANWVTGYFTELLKSGMLTPESCKITPENFAELLKMIEKGAVSKTAAKQVLAEMFDTGEDPSNIVEQKGLKQVSDTGEIEKVVDKVIKENAGVVSDFKGGKKQALGFLVGKVMELSKGQANPKLVNEILRSKLL